MADVRDLVTAALREIGELAAGETATTDQANWALEALGRLQDQWAAEELQIFARTRTTWTITANDGEYSVGSGGDVNIVRPVFVEAVHYIDTSTDPDTEYQMKPLTDMEYARWPQKARTNPTPARWYYNPTYTSARGTLLLLPVPTGSTLQGVIYHPTAVAKYTSLNTSVSLPPGYERMIVKNLAVEVAPSFEIQASPALVQQAMNAYTVVKRANRRNKVVTFGADVPGAGRHGYDIYTDS